MDYTIRSTNTGDATAIAEIGGITFAKAYGDIVLTTDMDSYVATYFDPQFLKDEIISGSASYFIAEGEQGVVGYAKISETPSPDALSGQRVIELIRLYVRPDFYGKGIGSALLEAVKQHAVKAGYAALWLRVWEKNSGAIRLYARDGFRELSVEPYYIGTTANPVVLMVRELP